ncbi:MAG: amidohydrolase family protein, partial [Nitriliruptoraceae bacterium]
MIVLRNGRLLDTVRQVDQLADVVIDDGTIAAVTEADAAPAVDDDTVIDCTGLWITTGFVDLHTHVREPGYEEAEDIATASRAAAHGGYTAVCPMANTDPVCDSAAVAELVWRRARDVGMVDMFPVGSITKGQAGTELTEFGELHDSAAAVDFFSDDGIPLADSFVMRRAL